MDISVNGINLHYEVQGSGQPLLLVHGNGEDHTIFQEAVEVLSRHFTCYGVDSRGHGASSPVKELHYRDMAEDMAAFLEALDLRNVVYYGFSDGGIVGLLTARKTDRLESMVISGANVEPHGMKDEIYQAIQQDYDATGNPKALMMLQEPWITKEQLKEIKLPVLVLAGSEDLIKEEHTRYIARYLPHSRLKILKGEGHETYIIHSRKIAEEILEFIEG